MKTKMKLARLRYFLLALVMVVGVMVLLTPTKANAANQGGYITKIEIDDLEYEIQEHMTGEKAYFTIRFIPTSCEKYTLIDNSEYLIQNEKGIGKEDVLKAGEGTLRLTLLGENGYQVYDGTEVWINGEKRTDVKIERGYGDPYHRNAQYIYIPITVSKYTGSDPRYTVNFHSNVGSAVESQSVPSGRYAYLPDLPKEDNQVFLGWYTDAKFTKKYVFHENKVTSDLDLYAKWDDKYITVIEVNDFYPIASESMTAQRVLDFATYSYPQGKYTIGKSLYQKGVQIAYDRRPKAGKATLRLYVSAKKYTYNHNEDNTYAFDKTNPDSIEIYINGKLRTDLEFEISEPNKLLIDFPITVYEYEEYSISVLGGKAIVNGTEATKAGVGDRVFLSANDEDAPDGTAFREWDVRGARLDFPKDSETIFIMPPNDVIATATYSKPYTVTVENGVLTDTGNSTGQYFMGDIVKIRANVYEGQTFAGWTSDDIVLDWTYRQTTSFKMPQKNVTLKAVVSSAAEITELEMTSDISAPAIGWEVTNPAFTVTKGNPVYIKKGWWEKYDDTSAAWNNYSGKTFEEGKYRYVARFNIDFDHQEYYLMNENAAVTVNGDSWEITGRLYYEDSDKLTGGWIRSPEYTAAKKYRVSFNANGGTGTMEDDIVLSGKASLYYRLPENGFTAPEGKYFKGWAISPDSTRVGAPSTQIPIGADKTFYAIWEDITYIDTVDVTITEPAVGANPQDGVSNTDKASASETVWYCNGIRMSASDKFEAGYTYKVYVTVNADDGCDFTDIPTVTFNGSIEGTISRFVDNSIIYYAEFTISIIDAVDVTITEPVVGANPKDAVSNTEHVSASEILWVRLNGGGFLSETDTFVGGDPYRAIVMVTADKGYVFAEDATVTINGSTKGTVALINNDSLYFYVDFTVELSARDKITNFVTRMYQQCLSREPDDSGLAGWVEQLESGQMNGAQIAEAFVFSNEMLNKNLSHEEFVKVLYRAMMGREADEEGLNGWMKELTNDYSTRSEVTKAFVESAEFTAICESYGIIRGDYVAVGDIERFVAGFYTKCLGRPADAAGHWGWVKQLQQKNLNGAQIAEAFFFSEEFVNKNVSDEVYIATLYRTILGREADETGLAGWVEQLQSSQMTRKGILGAFIESDEFTKLCARYGIERGSL